MTGKKKSERGQQSTTPVEEARERVAPRERPAPPTLVFVVCPLCGMSRKRERTGYRKYKNPEEAANPPKGAIHFQVDLDSYPFIEYREVGGRIAGLPRNHRMTGEEKSSVGFPRVGGLTLREAAESGQFEPLVEEIKTQIKHIQDILP